MRSLRAAVTAHPFRYRPRPNHRTSVPIPLTSMKPLATSSTMRSSMERMRESPLRGSVMRPSCEVNDSGPGIAAADAERIFERFFRGADSRETVGSGLGLYDRRKRGETRAAAHCVWKACAPVKPVSI